MQQGPTSQEQIYGKIYLDADAVVLKRTDEEILRLEIKDIRLIGEFTTANGPTEDDWYIVFMTSEKNWYQIPEYTPGMLELLQKLSGILGKDVMCCLFGSTIWATRILWPKTAAGEEMWNVEPAPASTLFQQLKKALGMGNQRLVLTPAAHTAFA